MAQYPIKHTCGHTVTHQLYGGSADRANKEGWLKTTPCLDCKRAGETAAAQTSAEAQQLPALTGSEKQVAWALKIRAEKLAEVGTLLPDFERRMEQGWVNLTAQDERLTAAAAQLAELLPKLITHTDARWWIDNRTAGVRTLLKEISRG